MFASLPVLAIVFTVYLPSTEAQTLCDTAGCLNGVCILPPVVAAPTCSCNPGFQLTAADPNVCFNIDECYGNTYICGVSFDPYLRISVPSGRCVNTPGSYYCMCNPNVALSSFDNKTCISIPIQQQQQQQQQLQQQSFYQSLLNLYLFDQFDLFDF